MYNRIKNKNVLTKSKSKLTIMRIHCFIGDIERGDSVGHRKNRKRRLECKKQDNKKANDKAGGFTMKKQVDSLQVYMRRGICRQALRRSFQKKK